MLGLYFSGTGNTAYAIKQFMQEIDQSAPIRSIENAKAVTEITQHDEIVVAYPIYYSNLPKIMKDFLILHQKLFQNKKIYIIVTMGLFSGDGSGCAARLLASYGAKILGGLHLKMPDCIADEKALKRPFEKNLELIHHADQKIAQAIQAYQNKEYTKDGLGVWYHLAGLFGQRLWFYGKTRHYSNRLFIDHTSCIQCGACVHACPMHNLSIKEHKVVTHNQCTMCYRCINTCPQKAITLLGKTVVEQYDIHQYRTF